MSLEVSSCAASFSWRASDRAATSKAGLSKKVSASWCEDNRERSSHSSVLSPSHTSRTKVSRSPGGCCKADCSSSSMRCHCSDCIGSSTAHFTVEPRLCGAPVAHHSDRRDIQHFGRLLDAEAAEETHLHNLHFTRIEPRQSSHGIIERHQIGTPLAVYNRHRFQRDMLQVAASFQIVSPGILHENASHQLRRYREKVRPVLPPHSLVIHQAHIGLVDQCSGFKAVSGTLSLHVGMSQAVQLVIDNGGQLFERALVSITPGAPAAC